MMGTAISVRHQLLLSCTITVQVPGKVVAVELFDPRMILGVTTPEKPGGRKVKLHVAGGVWVEIGFTMLIVV